MYTRTGLLRVLAFALCALPSLAQTTAVERVLIRTAKPYAKVVAAIESRGGKVTQQFRYVDAIAAEIPHAAMSDIRALAGVSTMVKDLIVEAPTNVDAVRSRQIGTAAAPEATYDSVSAIEAGAPVMPAAYIVNNTLMGLDSLHAAGKRGAGEIVAVIDSGIRPGFPHITLNNAVIGGEDFVKDGLGYSNFKNNGHGTFVGGMIAANVVLALERPAR